MLKLKGNILSIVSDFTFLSQAKLTLLHTERPIYAIICNFGLPECNRVKVSL